MIKTLKVTRKSPYTGELLGTLLFNPSSEHKLRNIEGVGPVKNNLIQAPRASGPGSIFLNTDVPARNILLHFDNLPDYANDVRVSDARRDNAHVLQPGREVTLEFGMSDNMAFTIDGVVEFNDTPMFEKESRSSVSIICTYPYFKVVGVPWVEVWPRTKSILELDYRIKNLAEVGILFESTLLQNVNSPTSSPHLYSRDSHDRSVLISSPHHSWVAGDKFVIDTRHGSRGVKLVRNLDDQNMLGYLRGSLSDFTLHEGINKLQYSYAGISSTQITWTAAVDSL